MLHRDAAQAQNATSPAHQNISVAHVRPVIKNLDVSLMHRGQGPSLFLKIFLFLNIWPKPRSPAIACPLYSANAKTLPPQSSCSGSSSPVLLSRTHPTPIANKGCLPLQPREIAVSSSLRCPSRLHKPGKSNCPSLSSH